MAFAEFRHNGIAIRDCFGKPACSIMQHGHPAFAVVCLVLAGKIE
ncbi:hypothetical protein ACU5AY_10350 [Rhizobium sp. PAMB 3174]